MNIQEPEEGLLALPDAVLSKILRSVAAPGHHSLCVLRLTCCGFRTVVDGLVGHLQVGALIAVTHTHVCTQIRLMCEQGSL